MKKFLSLLIIFGMVFMGVGGFGTAQAALTDTFNITVTVSYIEVYLRNVGDSADYGTWALSTQSVNTPVTMAAADGVRVMHGTSNQNTDIQSYVSNSGGVWSVGNAAASDTFKIEAEGSTSAAVPTFATPTVLTTSAQTIAGASNVSLDHYLYYKFTTPTDTTTGAEQSIEITVGVIVTP